MADPYTKSEGIEDYSIPEETPLPSVAEPVYNQPSGHVVAGKKAATSVKGAKWLQDVDRAFHDIRIKAQQQGFEPKLVQKITRTEAMEIASARRGTHEEGLREEEVTEKISNRLRNLTVIKEKKRAKSRAKNKSRRRRSITRQSMTRRRNIMPFTPHYADE